MKHLGMIAAAALAVAAPAQAVTLDFTITGDYSASFQLDSNPTPDDFFSGGYFTLWDVPGFPDAFFEVADISFFSASFDGGVQIEDFYGGSILLVTDGPQLYSGPESAPTFLTGTYELSEYLGDGTYTLVISAPLTGAVPEPASWAMMVGGLAVVGSAMRRRRTVVSFA